MWITGFDVPMVSTVYIDKPMKNHTLMQTIARANCRAEGKTSGVIVDYVGVFLNLQKSLAVYAGAGGEDGPGDGGSQIENNEALVQALSAALKVATDAIEAPGITTDAVIAVKGLQRTAVIAALLNPAAYSGGGGGPTRRSCRTSGLRRSFSLSLFSIPLPMPSGPNCARRTSRPSR